MKNCLSDVKKLAPSDLLDGTLLALGADDFSEQAIYALFKEIETEQPSVAGWFEVTGSEGDLRSEPLRGLLNFMESGKILQISPPNPVDQFYHVRKEQKQTILKDLKDHGVLPRYQGLFKELAKRLRRLTREQKQIASVPTELKGD